MTSDQVNVKKWRPWRFSLRTLLSIVLVIALYLGYRDIQMRLNAKKELVRTLVDSELVSRHFFKSDAQLMNLFRKDLSRPNVKFQTLQVGTGVVLVKPTPAIAMDEFQKESLRRINSGDQEAWQTSWNGGIRYVAKLKAARSCAVCHSGQGNNMDFVVSLDLE